MKLMKANPQPQPEASTEVSLADRIRAVCADAQEYIEAHVQKEKAAHPSIPIDWIRLNTYAVARAKGCHCRCALKLLGDKQDGR